MIKPIFVVGTNRSGTTWLGNIISSHPDVAAIQSSNHHQFYTGVIESFYFSHVYGRYGDLRIRQNYIEFVEAIGICDYFKLAGVDKSFLYNLYPANYEQVFKAVMDSYAEKQGAGFWLEKSPSHSKLLSLITKCYPEAKVISIKRDVYDVVASSLGLRFRYDETRKNDANIRKQTIVSAIKNYYQVNKSLGRFSKNNPKLVHAITYADLINNYENTLAGISDFIGLENDHDLVSNYPKNTSFAKSKDKSNILTNKEKALFKRLNFYYKLLPNSILSFKDFIRPKLKNKFRMFNNSKLPNWFYNFHEFPKSEL